MLTLKQIEAEYPVYLRSFKKNILKEYLQYKILESLFSHPLAQKLRFIGGTALRIIHGLNRFSEDLDFDCIGLTFSEFKGLSERVMTDLEREGYEVSISFPGQSAFRCNVRIPNLMFDMGLSPLRQEKILIQLDTEAQQFHYQPELAFINKFDVFRDIWVTPISILLSQKIVTAFSRKRPKGRDFFDIIFLMGKTTPDFQFLRQKIGVSTWVHLNQYLQEQCKKILFESLIRDLKPFVFNPEDAEKIIKFPEFVSRPGPYSR